MRLVDTGAVAIAVEELEALIGKPFPGGSYTIELSHYDVVPGNVLQEIISKAQMKEEEEE